ncbi:MAG: hypothetical protein ACRDYB_11320 [Acidimicrobiales bacterium]
MITKPLSHEKRVCLYAAQQLANARNGGVVTADSYPDEEERQLPAIDLAAHDNNGPISVEHTLIEPYSTQLHDNRRVLEVFSGFAERFRHSLDSPGRYTLGIHTRGGHLFPRRSQAEEIDRLESWVHAQRLPVPVIPPRSPNSVTATPPEVPITVTLYRMRCAAEDDGSLYVAFLRPDDLEGQRADRIRKALTDKSAKLEAARQPGGVTLLALESHDYIMSNPVFIARGVYAAARDSSALPDIIVCVETSAGEDHWIPYLIKNLAWWSDAAQSLPAT